MGLFVLGYIAHSNNTHKATTKNVGTMLDQNKELVELSSTIEILNRDIDKKNSQIEDLKGEAAHQQENVNRLLSTVPNRPTLQKMLTKKGEPVMRLTSEGHGQNVCCTRQYSMLPA